MANSDDDIDSDEYIRSLLCTRSPKPSVVIHHDLPSDQMNNLPGQSTQQNQDQNYHQAPSQQVYTVNQPQNNQANIINHAVPNQIQQVRLPMRSNDDINSEEYIWSLQGSRSPKPSVVIHHGSPSDHIKTLSGQSTQQSQDQNYCQAPSQQVYTANQTQNNQANIINHAVLNQIQQVRLPMSCNDDINSEEYIWSLQGSRSPKPSVVIHHGSPSDQKNILPENSTQQNQNYHQAHSQQVYTANQPQNNQANIINHVVPNQIQQVKLPISSHDDINSEEYIWSLQGSRSPKPSVVIHHGSPSDQINNLPGQSTQQSQDQNYCQAPSLQAYTANQTQNNQANIINHAVPNQIQQVKLPMISNDDVNSEEYTRNLLCTRSPKPSVVIHHGSPSGQRNILPENSSQQNQNHYQQVNQLQNNQANIMSQVVQNQNQQIMFPINSDYIQFNTSSNHVDVSPGTALLQQNNSNSSANNYDLQFDSYNLPSTSQQFTASDLSISDLYNQFDVDNLDESIPPPTEYQQTKKSPKK